MWPAPYGSSGYQVCVVKIDYVNGEHVFEKALVLDHNIEQMAKWRKPENYLGEEIPEHLVQLSNEIVGSETDEYQQIYLLNYWGADNIYYDYDCLSGKSSADFDGICEHKRAVCNGYAHLLQLLIQAQGIPCKSVSSYAAGLGTTGRFDESNYMTNESNHAYVEAYVNGQWVIMDPTWDSHNTYMGGEYYYSEPGINFFDASLDSFSFSHKIQVR